MYFKINAITWSYSWELFESNSCSQYLARYYRQRQCQVCRYYVTLTFLWSWSRGRTQIRWPFEESCVGCHIGCTYDGAFGYADDVALLASSLSCLKSMIKISGRVDKILKKVYSVSKYNNNYTER